VAIGNAVKACLGGRKKAPARDGRAQKREKNNKKRNT